MSFPFGNHKTQTNMYKAIRCATASVKAINARGSTIGRITTTSAAFQILRERGSFRRVIG
jgi:phosphatidate phosphatase PAH1